MDTSTCATIVLVLLWLHLCCQALGSLIALIDEYSTDMVLASTITFANVLLAVCIWQCKKAGYLVSPMTWYHWALLVLLVVLQVLTVVLEERGWGILNALVIRSTYPIYGIVVVILGILGGTLYCGWKCNLFCRPFCKSQYICYGSAIVVALVLLIVLAVTASLMRFVDEYSTYADEEHIDEYDAGADIRTIGYHGKILVLVTQCYTMAMIWNTVLRLPYTISEVVSLIASALAVASILAVAVPNNMKLLDRCYPLLAAHLVSLGVTLYCLEYQKAFYWPKDYQCFGILAAVVILVALVLVVLQFVNEPNSKAAEYILLGYSIVLMVPVFWYAYRCGLFTWCLPKKKGSRGY
ncbi:putative integral membrane protein [Babesia bovis T2Bo]|uniref:putative integral membrane protein n=1 Tax=Babesia bovis T2Bo TaxID=484906 RepID=UPI001C355228|nr:putative integral membrane protein [Babesia bovis T2Bo]EDO06734.2 putative integral membrane protein [Babesia bovis T2Bo]